VQRLNKKAGTVEVLRMRGLEEVDFVLPHISFHYGANRIEVSTVKINQ
jgi:hypothetical protein